MDWICKKAMATGEKGPQFKTKTSKKLNSIEALNNSIAASVQSKSQNIS
jgi:hypothetical protein